MENAFLQNIRDTLDQSIAREEVKYYALARADVESENFDEYMDKSSFYGYIRRNIYIYFDKLGTTLGKDWLPKTEEEINIFFKDLVLFLANKADKSECVYKHSEYTQLLDFATTVKEKILILKKIDNDLSKEK